MENAIKEFLLTAIDTIKLRQPTPAWTLEGFTDPLPTKINPILAPPCPLPFDYDIRSIIDSFRKHERRKIRSQIDDGHDKLYVLGEIGDFLDQDIIEKRTDVVHIQLGVPIFGSERCFIYMACSNFLENDNGDRSFVQSEHSVWLDPEGTNIFENKNDPEPPEILSPWVHRRW